MSSAVASGSAARAYSNRWSAPENPDEDGTQNRIVLGRDTSVEKHPYQVSTQRYSFLFPKFDPMIN